MIEWDVMSDHYCIAVSCYLRDDVPPEVHAVLDYMVDPRHREPPIPPDHQAFREENLFDDEIYHPWRHLLQAESNHFPGPFGGAMVPEKTFVHADGIRSTLPCSLTFRCGILDDDIGDYFYFLEWLAPYTDTRNLQGFVGYIQDTIVPGSPGLLYFIDGRVRMGNGVTTWDLWQPPES
jgi:hypothetical protein